MSLLNILSRLCVLIIVIPNFFISFNFNPIPIHFHRNYSFSLNEYSRFIIYSFRNEMNIDDDLVFRFGETPNYSSKLYLYFSVNDVSENIETLINCNPYTGEFFGSFYNIVIDRISNNEVVINSNKCDNQYLIPGYIYAVISIVSISENPEYKSNLIIYNTQYMPEISTSNLYEYFKFGGEYRKNITFLIPKLSNDIILRLGYATSDRNYYKYLYIYQNNLDINNIFNTTRFLNNLGLEIKLLKGNSYYFQIYHSRGGKYIDEILFQFPPEELIKIEEGKVICTSSFILDEYYYFYYDNSKMQIGDELYFKVIQNNNKSKLLYKELTYNDYDYIYQRRNTDNSKYCEIIQTNNIGNIITHFYRCVKNKESMAFLFMITDRIGYRIFPNFQIEIFSKKKYIIMMIFQKY